MKILVNNLDDMRDAIDGRAELKTEGDDLPHSMMCGIPVEVDQRLPEKVWAMVPRGGGLMDPDVRIGYFDESGESAARNLKSILELTRTNPVLY